MGIFVSKEEIPERKEAYVKIKRFVVGVSIFSDTTHLTNSIC